MGSETVGTLVITGVLVAVLAAYVTLIGLGLRRLSFTLGTVVVGLRAIRMQTQPVGDVLGGVLADVTDIERDLGEAVTAVAEELGGAPASLPAQTVADEYDDEDELDEEDFEEDFEEEAAEEAPPAVRLNIRPQVRVPARR